MITLAYGTLPTPSALHGPAHAAGVTANGVLSLCRRLMAARNFGGALLLLNSLGFTWAAAPTLPDAKLQEDIDAVAAALGGEVDP